MPDGISGQIPAPAAPLVSADGNITVAWRAYLLILQRRTGGTVGTDAGAFGQRLDAETAARIAGDSALQAAIDAEVAARVAAITAEQTARVAGDAFLNAIQQSTTTMLTNEILRAQAAEALLVPLDQLCALWSQCDLSFLPTADPGGGRPWNNGGHIAINPVVAVVGIGLEDASGRWAREDGTGAWIWG